MKESPDPLLLRDAIKSLGNALRAEQHVGYINTTQPTGLDAFIDDWLCDYPGIAQYPPLTVVVNALRGYDVLSLVIRQQRGEASLRALLALYNAAISASVCMVRHHFAKLPFHTTIFKTTKRLGRNKRELPGVV